MQAFENTSESNLDTRSVKTDEEHRFETQIATLLWSDDTEGSDANANVKRHKDESVSFRSLGPFIPNPPLRPLDHTPGEGDASPDDAVRYASRVVMRLIASSRAAFASSENARLPVASSGDASPASSGDASPASSPVATPGIFVRWLSYRVGMVATASGDTTAIVQSTDIECQRNELMSGTKVSFVLERADPYTQFAKCVRPTTERISGTATSSSAEVDVGRLRGTFVRWIQPVRGAVRCTINGVDRYFSCMRHNLHHCVATDLQPEQAVQFVACTTREGRMYADLVQPIGHSRVSFPSDMSSAAAFPPLQGNVLVPRITPCVETPQPRVFPTKTRAAPSPTHSPTLQSLHAPARLSGVVISRGVIGVRRIYAIANQDRFTYRDADCVVSADALLPGTQVTFQVYWDPGSDMLCAHHID